jgi:agmatine/peptidylarginine deiminase
MKRQALLRVLLGLSAAVSLYGCTSSSISSVPATTSALGTSNYPDRNQPAFKRSGIVKNASGTYSFVADCASGSGFRVNGNLEGEPCETDSFANTDKFYIAPEYDKAKAVIVSDYISQIPGGEDIINGILEAGSDVWYLNGDNSDNSAIYSHLNTKSSSKVINFNITADTVWARDWAPLMAIPAADYQGEKIDLKMVDANYYDNRPLDDSISRQIKNEQGSTAAGSLGLSLKRTSLPVYMEGGNIMCNEKNCFLTRRVIEENSKKLQPNDIILDEDSLKKEFKKQLEQDTWFVPEMPYEPTKHIDMWAKFLNKDTVLIASLSDETLNASGSRNLARLREVQDFLETEATGKDKSGKTVANSLAYLLNQQNPSIKIVRVPMPAPAFYTSTNTGENIEVFRSYTNSLLLNGYALVPQYSTDMYTELPYKDADLKQQYENTVAEAYQQAGYQVLWVPADYFIGMGGAVHCVTMQVPG